MLKKEKRRAHGTAAVLNSHSNGHAAPPSHRPPSSRTRKSSTPAPSSSRNSVSQGSQGSRVDSAGSDLRPDSTSKDMNTAEARNRARVDAVSSKQICESILLKYQQSLTNNIFTIAIEVLRVGKYVPLQLLLCLLWRLCMEQGYKLAGWLAGWLA